MTRHATHPDPATQGGGILCVCRDPGTRRLLDRYVKTGRVYLSAVDALLAAARERPAAVVLAFDPGVVSARQVVAAFRRTQPSVPVYGVVRAEDEPLARSLLGAGLADYLVLPRDARRLPDVIAGQPEPGESPGPRPSGTVPRSLFEASCGLADLALAEPLPLFRDGSRLILDALRAARGCAFVWSEQDDRLDLAVTVGGDEGLGASDPEPVRSAASRCLRTGERLWLPPGTAGAPPGGLLCVPVRDQESTVGVICLSATRAQGSLAPEDDRRGADGLAGILARLYRAAMRQQQYARLAYRDVETGLLKANPFLTYVDSRIAEARDRQTEFALILLEPEPSIEARTADSPARLGLAVRGALASGWEGGRIDTARYAVALPPSAEPEAARTGEDPWDSAARLLAGAAPRAHPALSLRTAIARFPRDGTTAQALVSAAATRLRPNGDPRLSP